MTVYLVPGFWVLYFDVFTISRDSTVSMCMIDQTGAIYITGLGLLAPVKNGSVSSALSLEQCACDMQIRQSNNFCSSSIASDSSQWVGIHLSDIQLYSMH